ncbi:MAG: SRPBCC domain-containing protein [Pseudomonadota bacterium]
MTDLTLKTTRHIQASPETVFDAWLDPAILAKFMMPGEGMTVPKAESDAREGGRFAIVMAAGDQEIPHGGEYKEISRPNRLVFTWESPFSVDGSTVTLSLKSSDAGGTDLELVHVKFTDEETRDNHLGGWNGILAKLDEVLSA